LSDQEVILKCLSGKHGAFKIIVERYSGSLLTIIRRYISNNEDCKDVLQESFISIFKSLHSYEETRGALYTWMRTITARQAIQHINKKKQIIFTEDIISSENLFKFQPEVMNKLDEETLINVINKIGEDYRIVFNLFYFEDLTHKEIGKLLNIKESSSRSKLTRARRLIISEMKSMNFEIPKFAI